MIHHILVEGPDCSGKSVLVNRIKNELHWDSKSLHHKAGNQFWRYLQEYTQAEHVVLDRGHFSENVYSRLWRGGNPFSIPEKLILDNTAIHESLVVFVCPPLEIMQKRYLARQYEQQISLEELARSRQLFKEVLADVQHRVISYEAKTYAELENILVLIKQEVER